MAARWRQRARDTDSVGWARRVCALAHAVAFTSQCLLRWSSHQVCCRRPTGWMAGWMQRERPHSATSILPIAQTRPEQLAVRPPSPSPGAVPHAHVPNPPPRLERHANGSSQRITPAQWRRGSLLCARLACTSAAAERRRLARGWRCGAGGGGGVLMVYIWSAVQCSHQHVVSSAWYLVRSLQWRSGWP